MLKLGIDSQPDLQPSGLVLRCIQMIQPLYPVVSLIGWVELSETHCLRSVAMGFALLYPSYASSLVNHVIGSEH
jgi:hypothetical protein